MSYRVKTINKGRPFYHKDDTLNSFTPRNCYYSLRNSNKDTNILLKINFDSFSREEVRKYLKYLRPLGIRIHLHPTLDIAYYTHKHERYGTICTMLARYFYDQSEKAFQIARNFIKLVENHPELNRATCLMLAHSNGVPNSNHILISSKCINELIERTNLVPYISNIQFKKYLYETKFQDHQLVTFPLIKIIFKNIETNKYGTNSKTYKEVKISKKQREQLQYVPKW